MVFVTFATINVVVKVREKSSPPPLSISSHGEASHWQRGANTGRKVNRLQKCRLVNPVVTGQESHTKANLAAISAMPTMEFVPKLPAMMLSCARPSGRTAVLPYRAIDSLFDLRNKRVTIWKNILSLFGGVGANHFEGVRGRDLLADG